MGFADKFWHQRHVGDFHKKRESAEAKLWSLVERMKEVIDSLALSRIKLSDEEFDRLFNSTQNSDNVLKMKEAFGLLGRELDELREQAGKLGEYSDIWERYEHYIFFFR